MSPCNEAVIAVLTLICSRIRKCTGGINNTEQAICLVIFVLYSHQVMRSLTLINPRQSDKEREINLSITKELKMHFIQCGRRL